MYHSFSYHFLASSLILGSSPTPFSFCFLALDDTHASATITTCYTTTSTTTTTTTTTATTTTTINQAKKLKIPKNTLQTRPQALYSQRIVIGSEELHGRDIDNVVRQKINTLEKSPKVVRSTALIVKRSVALAKSRSSPVNKASIATTTLDGFEQTHSRRLPNGNTKTRFKSRGAGYYVDGAGESMK
jgi:hypothetical protein